MQQIQINNWWTANYKDLLLYAKKWIISRKRQIEPAAALAEAYIYIYDRRNDIQDAGQLSAWTKHWLKKNIDWQENKLSKTETSRAKEMSTEIGNTRVEYSLDAKINELVQGFAATITDKLDKRIFLLYWVTGLQTGALLSSHINVSISQGYIYLARARKYEAAFRAWVVENTFI
jgi:hypothetical protein